MPAVPHRTVSGRYRGRRGKFEVELRVDVDGPRTCKRVSADYFRASDGSYIGSMRVETPTVSFGASHVKIAGTGTFTWQSRARRITVTIARALAHEAPAPATLRHSVAGAGGGTAYRCAFQSACFRSVDFEEACQQNVSRFTAYDTSSLPEGGPARTLTAVAAFAEAGIELVTSGEPVVIDTSHAGSNATWSDAELHAAMAQHFTRMDDRPRWAVWLLHATAHDDPELFGLMFDQIGVQRQGCAVFYGLTQRSSAESLRDQLHTCVHELGHAFNLMHCWQKSRADPPLPGRPDAASWMNYPQLFPGGADRYWEKFAFGFDELELAHLRHAAQKSIIMGGNPFATGAALIRPRAADQEAQDPGLRLRLIARPEFRHSMPVTVGLELSATARAGRRVPPVLGPRPGTVDIGIRGPDGRSFAFEPLLDHCRGERTMTLQAHQRPLRDDAFIHYGKGGFAFEEPGVYRARARFTAVDGSIVLSNWVTIKIHPPRTGADRDVARLVAGNDQVGTLLSLMGSDAPELRAGDDALQEVTARHPTHPMAAVARLVRATNAARPFKSVAADGGVRVREPRLEEARALVAHVVDIEQVERVAAAASDTADGLRMTAQALRRVGTKPGMSGALDGLIAARKMEIASAVPVRASQSLSPI